MDMLTLENNAICRLAEEDARQANQKAMTIVPVVLPS